jgi:hypothetical protein
MSQSYKAFHALVPKTVVCKFQYHAPLLTDMLEPALQSFVPL